MAMAKQGAGGPLGSFFLRVEAEEEEEAASEGWEEVEVDGRGRGGDADGGVEGVVVGGGDDMAERMECQHCPRAAGVVSALHASTRAVRCHDRGVGYPLPMRGAATL